MFDLPALLHVVNGIESSGLGEEVRKDIVVLPGSIGVISTI